MSKSLLKLAAAEIDSVAGKLSNTDLAKRLDKVANTIEAVVEDTEPGNPSDEAGRMDEFQANEERYHTPLPVGDDNVLETVGVKSVKDLDLTFGDEGHKDLQAAELPLEVFDLGDPADNFSTGALPESGDNEAVDDDQKGGVLESGGTQPAGTLHASENVPAELEGVWNAALEKCEEAAVSGKIARVTPAIVRKAMVAIVSYFGQTE